jgi:SulP family sulfate permease
VGGSFSRSALNRLAGGRTRWSGAITGLAVLAILPFAGVLQSIPTSVLGAIVIAAVLPLLQLGPILELWRPSRPQFVIAAVAFVLTLLLAPHVERAVAIGVALAIAVHLWRELRVDVDTELQDGELHAYPRGVLWFATAPALEDRLVDALAAHPRARQFVIHLDGVGRLDVSAALALRGVIELAESAGLEAVVTGVPGHARRVVQGVLERDLGDGAYGPPGGRRDGAPPRAAAPRGRGPTGAG